MRAPRPAVFCARLAAGGVGSRGGVSETGCGRTPRRLAPNPSPKIPGLWGAGTHAWGCARDWGARGCGKPGAGLGAARSSSPSPAFLVLNLSIQHQLCNQPLSWLSRNKGRRFGTAHFHFFFEGGIKIALHFFVVNA